MPEIGPEKRASGGRVFNDPRDDPHNGEPCDCDWTTPKTAAQLRHRVLPTADQTRYGPRPQDRQETPE